MSNYALTVFEKNGATLLNELFEASDHDEAKKISKQLLEKSGYTEYTYRCVSPDGQLLLFQR
ncbi:YhzD family protein [Aquibacillus rhizosphaerae]|uniref:YhzD family protein n=1 Tax=Aquibacillus rhizosphaerae TaxID=3051431 RepID=A0ABT7LDR9_9BACI|nr:YhzD family protein [Aquibacillus sp. LR5S19]MDL4842740.1 YhzD family protein [Aquibacillus sp. LR5S19]